MSQIQKQCPECQEHMQPIKLLDATEPLGHTGCRHVELAYGAPDAKASLFIGRIPNLGLVKGLICTGCGRILLYGVPKDS